ncbi:helix-turn-helix domain-containing protein [Pseudodesulfovibrio sp.]|uniref:helix-turn-helix domain-containing protein n=1 Tax=unclassified Pseudodesulfovibrio TaxID=2661612 RepID=UPI003B00912E
MEDAYTHKDLAELCSVSETTIKSYRRKFPGFIPVLTQGKPIRFRKEAGEVCLAIRDCFAKGMSVKETLAALKERFTPEAPPERSPFSPRPAVATGGGSSVSSAQLDKFFETAGRMMQGMAALATAQAKSERRMEKVESALNRLLEQEVRNNEIFSQTLDQLGSPAPDTPHRPTSTGDGAPAPEKMRARKIVNVRGSGGEVNSYALEKDDAEPEQPQPTTPEPTQPEPVQPNPAASMVQPPEDLLAMPIVIRTEHGEFLGMPGRLSLAGFVEALVRDAEERGASLSRWEQENNAWVYIVEVPGGSSHTLCFMATTTPRGNSVALLDRLVVDGRVATPRFLQEFFRQIKDRI